MYGTLFRLQIQMTKFVVENKRHFFFVLTELKEKRATTVHNIYKKIPEEIYFNLAKLVYKFLEKFSHKK